MLVLVAVTGALRTDVHTDTKVRWTTQAVASMLAHTVTVVGTLCGASLYMTTSSDEVWAALALGAVPSVGLLVGAIAGSFSRMPHQRIAMAMSVGAGLLLAGVSLKVAADAIRIAGPIGSGAVAGAWGSGVQREQRASRAVRCRSPQAMR